MKYDLYGLDSRQLTYQGHGVWSSDNFHIRTSSYMNRYRFIVKFTDGSKQYYGRMSTLTGNPTYGLTPSDYFYVQPTIDSDADHWSPCFQYPSAYENVENRYYCTMTLSLNNENGHYTHSVTKVWDKVNPLTTGEDVYVWGSAVASPDVAGVQMRYSPAFYNTGVQNAGDRVDESPSMSDPVGYDYEIFVKLNAGQKFYFSTESGHNFGLNSAGNGIEGIFTENDLSYGGVTSGGLYRIRINLPSGEAQLLRVGIVNYSIIYGNVSENLGYDKAGAWKLSNYAFAYATNQGWDPTLSRYRFSIWFNWIGGQGGRSFDAWQVYGNCTSINNSNLKPQTEDPADGYYYLQPFTGDDWDTIFYLPDWLFDSNKTNRSKKGTLNLYMNNTYGHFTHGFSDVVDNN